jgi:hypothetical protein
LEILFVNIQKISEFFYQKASNKNIIITAISYLLLGILIMPRLTPLIEQNSGLSILDLRFGYSSKSATELFEKIGPIGCSNYLKFTATADMAYPLVYGLFLSLFISYLFEKAFRKTYEFRMLNLLPLLIVVADYVENFSIIILLNQHPILSENLVKIASNATLIKWGAVVFSILVVFIGLFGWSFKTLLLKLRK